MATLIKYGLIKYGEAKYGGGVRAEETLSLEVTSFSIKHNDTTIFSLNLSDSVEFSDSLTSSSGFHKTLTEDITISDRGKVLYGDHVPFGDHPVFDEGGGFELLIIHFLELSDSISIKITFFSTNYNGEEKAFLELEDSLEIAEGLDISTGYFPSLTDSIAFSEDILINHGWRIAVSDTLTIAESVGNGTTIGLSDSIGITVSSLGITLTEGKTLKTDWKFLIRTSAGSYVASLVSARERWFKEALNHGGSAGFILEVDDPNCNSTILAINSNELIIQYKGFDMWGGQISTVRKVASGNSRYWEVTCSQFFNLLTQRYCGYDKSTGLSDAREFTTTDAGVIAWTLIDESQNEVNGDLGITEGTLEVSLNRTKSYEKKNIAEAIIELADNDYGFDFEITTDKVFNVYYPFKGTVRDEVVFRYPGNCLEMESMENGLDVVNHELGLGRHWGGQEIYYIADDVTSQLAYGRREKIESYKDVEMQAYLTDMVDEDITWNKNINKVVKFKSFIDRKSDLYMYELGDSVRVVADAFSIDEQLFVYERQVTIDDNDQPTVNLTLGD